MKNIRSEYGFIRTIRNRRSKPMSYSTRAGACGGESARSGGKATLRGVTASVSSELSSREHCFVTGLSKTVVPRASSCRVTFTRPVRVILLPRYDFIFRRIL